MEVRKEVKIVAGFGIWKLVGAVASVVGLGAALMGGKQEKREQEELIAKKVAEAISKKED